MNAYSQVGRPVVLGALLGTAGLVLAACGTGSNAAPSTQGSSSSSGIATPVGTRTTGGTVTVAEPPATTPNWIFPMASLAYFSVYNISDLQQPMYKPLYWFGGHNDQPTVDYSLSPAKAPTYAANGKSVTISLKGWKWSNGESVDAKDVAFWMNMVKAEKANWAGYVPGAFPDNVTQDHGGEPLHGETELLGEVLRQLVHLQRALPDHTDADGVGRHLGGRPSRQRRLYDGRRQVPGRSTTSWWVRPRT